jgi:hypothetical protein
MNLPIRLLFITGLSFLCTTGFTARSKTSTTSRAISYYWYAYPSDTYHDYCSTNAEAYLWWIYYDGVIIDSNPIGGTLIARGYLSNTYPHISYPYAFLYAHF